MLNRKPSANSGLMLSLIILLVIVVSINYLDERIALAVMSIIRAVKPLKKATETIPDLLPHFVVIATVMMWAIYFYRLHKKKFDLETQFLRFAATVLPIAYLVKTFSKFIFGRTDPRAWLIHHQTLTFHWLKIRDSSFPSGHMTVFAAFGAAVLLYYPKYRKLVFILVTLLGLSLVITDYHFLSDVLAGAYFGIVTAYALKYLFEKSQIRN